MLQKIVKDKNQICKCKAF